MGAALKTFSGQKRVPHWWLFQDKEGCRIEDFLRTKVCPTEGIFLESFLGKRGATLKKFLFKAITNGESLINQFPWNRYFLFVFFSIWLWTKFYFLERWCSLCNEHTIYILSYFIFNISMIECLILILNT